MITDVITKNQYPFVCDAWLAVESIHGEIEKLLPVANKKELAGFNLVFGAKTAKGLLDDHIWFSVFLRPKESTFTRVQRLSCCLSLIFLTMITNAMFFGAGDAPGAKKIIRLGNMKIDLTGIIIGTEASIIVILPSLLIIEIFRRLKPKSKKETSNRNNNEKKECLNEIELQNNITKKGKKREPFMFPNQFKYLAYTVVFLSSFGSALFTFFYSMMWGPIQSNEWLASMMTGFFQSVLVIQPVKAVIMAVLLAAILQKPVEQEHDEEEQVESKTQIEDGGCEEADIDGDDNMISADEIPFIR